MTVAIKVSRERRTTKHFWIIVYVFRCNDRLIEDLAAGKVGIQIDVVGQDEVLVVIFGILAKQHQVLGRSYLVWIVWFAGATSVFFGRDSIDIVEKHIGTVGRRGGFAGQVDRIVFDAKLQAQADVAFCAVGCFALEFDCLIINNCTGKSGHVEDFFETLAIF